MRICSPLAYTRTRARAGWCCRRNTIAADLRPGRIDAERYDRQKDIDDPYPEYSLPLPVKDRRWISPSAARPKLRSPAFCAGNDSAIVMVPLQTNACRLTGRCRLNIRRPSPIDHLLEHLGNGFPSRSAYLTKDANLRFASSTTDDSFPAGSRATKKSLPKEARLEGGELCSRYRIVGIENSAPSLMPDGQREVMVLVRVQNLIESVPC